MNSKTVWIARPMMSTSSLRSESAPQTLENARSASKNRKGQVVATSVLASR
jgi:hypothetical protein